MKTRLICFIVLICWRRLFRNPKKAVSAVAVSVGGIGLFTAPAESAQAQLLSYSGVNGGTLTFDSPSDMTSDLKAISVDFHVFDTLSYYDVLLALPFTVDFSHFMILVPLLIKTVTFPYSSPVSLSTRSDYCSFWFHL